MSIDVNEFRETVISVLKELDLYSPAAEELIVGTAAHESGLQDIQQYGGGPALGVCQMEPSTHDDIWDNYLAYRSSRSESLRDMFGAAAGDADSLLGNVPYSVAMCRMHYCRVAEALPDADNLRAQAEYWKEHYNTALGAGTVKKYIDDYKRIVKGEG